MGRALAMALAAFAISGIARAADWREAGRAGLEIYWIDFESARQINDMGIRKFWVKLTPKARPEARSRTLQRWEISCPAHQVRVTSAVKYGEDDGVLDSREAPQTPFTDIVPESITEAVEELVCAAERPIPRPQIVLPAPPSPPPPAPSPPLPSEQAAFKLVRSMAVPAFEEGIPGAKFTVLGPVSVVVSQTTSLEKPPSKAKLSAKIWEAARAMGADAVINVKFGQQKLGLMAFKKQTVTGDAVKLDSE